MSPIDRGFVRAASFLVAVLAALGAAAAGFTGWSLVAAGEDPLARSFRIVDAFWHAGQEEVVEEILRSARGDSLEVPR